MKLKDLSFSVTSRGDLSVDQQQEGEQTWTRFEAIKLRNYLNDYINGKLEESDEDE